MPRCLVRENAARVTWAGTLAILCGACGPRSVLAEPLFTASFYAYESGTRPSSVAVEDLNRDGRLDLVAANSGDNTVSVLLGIGDGTFQPKRTFPTGWKPEAVAVADFNADGELDLVTANDSSNTVSVLLGSGGVSYGPPADYRTGSHPISLAIGDLNADGSPDLAIACNGYYDSGTVSLLLGNGDGTFRVKTDYAAGFHPTSVAIGDLSGDGRLDVVATNNGLYQVPGAITVRLGNGDGTLGAKTDFTTGPQPSAVAIGDLNGDATPDLAVANYGSLRDAPHTVSVLLGNGDGTFAPKSDLYAYTEAWSIVIGDLNHDGRSDLLVSFALDKIGVYLGNGDGTFGHQVLSDTGSGPVSIAIGELNGDERLDVACAAIGAQGVAVLFGNGDGSFGPGEGLWGGSAPTEVQIADLNGDGGLDLLVTDPGTWVNDDRGNKLLLFLGHGDGTFEAAAEIPIGGWPRATAIGDLNADGVPDLAVAKTNANTVAILLGLGGGTFGAPTEFPVGEGPGSVVIGDFNSDHRADLAVANTSSNTVGLLPGNGDGTFASPLYWGTGIAPRALRAVDLDLDGNQDLAVANWGSDTVTLLGGNGNGDFWRSDLETGHRPTAIAAGDLDGDGFPDLVVTDSESSSLSVLRRNAGSWLPPASVPVGVQPNAVALGDLDQDGKLDAVVANTWSHTISVLFGRGDGSFAPRLDFGTPLLSFGVAIGDLNSDGRPDLAATGWSHTTSLLFNRMGPVTPVFLTDLGARSTPRGVQLSWNLSSQAFGRASLIRVQRADAATGPYQERAAVRPDRGVSFEDADVVAGRTYWYRLLLVMHDGTCVVAGPLRVQADGEGSARVALRAAFESASGGPVQIQYSIAAAHTAVRLRVFDARGRQLWASERKICEPGMQVETWDRSSTGGTRTPRGVFLLRLDADDVTATRKLVLVRP